MKIEFTISALLLIATAVVDAQFLDPTHSLQWPTYNGDYSGRRFSDLSEINAANVKNLSLAWVYHAAGDPAAGPAANLIKSTPLEVNGVLFFTMPDYAWAIDSRTGREIWHFKWESKGGIHIGSRGVGIYGNWLYFETPDCHLVSLEAQTGKLRWTREIADVKQEYFCTSAPVVVGRHIIDGVGGDSLDVPGYLEGRDPETGDVQWRWNTTPRPGEPGAETWPSKDAMEHGGGMTWMPGTYDPELNLYYVGTGNPNPVHAAQSRKGANLWTCSIVALNPDTGKMAWYYQVSPHDTHDWDDVETPVLFNGAFGGRPRKLLAQAARNGHFVVLDRSSGEHLLTKPFIETLNWSNGVDAKGHPIPDPAKEPKTDGTLVSPHGGGATNWWAPSFDPETKLFYVNAATSYSVYYLTDTEDKPEGYGGRDSNVWIRHSLKAIDYQSGKIVWTHNFPGGAITRAGILSTAGNLLFTGDLTGNLVAFDPAAGTILWHAGIGAPVSNGPMTFELDGRQYLVVAGGSSLFAFMLPGKPVS